MIAAAALGSPSAASDVAPAALAQQIASGTAPLVLDVRSRREFDAGHVPGAVHIPFWTMPWRSATVPAALDDPIVVYCGHGPRAQFAAAALRRHGFTRVRCLAGHMKQWRAQSHDVAR